MGEQDTREVAAVGIHLLDDAHATWLAAELECGHALQAWFEAGQRTGAYNVYRAALEREEAAARDLRRLFELTAPCAEILVSGGTADGKEAVR
jgi:hypothetical protein